MDILELARKADLFVVTNGDCDIEDLERFAYLVADIEREACADVCKEVAEAYRGGRYGKAAEVVCDNCVEFIRARSNSK